LKQEGPRDRSLVVRGCELDGADSNDEEEAKVFLKNNVGGELIHLCDLHGEECVGQEKVGAKLHVEDGGRGEGALHGGLSG